MSVHVDDNVDSNSVAHASVAQYWRYPTSSGAFLRSIPALLTDGSTLVFSQGDIGGGVNTSTGVTANGVGAFTLTGGVPGVISDYGGGNALATSGACGRYNGRPFVSALAGTKDDLYVSGGFDSIGGITTGAVARRRVVGGVATWSSLGGLRGVCGNHTFGDYWSVRALAVAGSNVYAAGTFLNANGTSTTDGSTTVNQIAMWNGTSWEALGGGAKTTTSDSSPDNVTWPVALAWDPTRQVLYMGGYFDSVSNTIGGAAIANTAGIACWNPTSSTWSALGSGSSTTTNRVRALQLDSTGNLVVGGSFSTMGGISVDRIARFTPTGACTGTWSGYGSPPFSSRCTADPDITALAADPTSNDLFASCKRDGGMHPNVAKWDGSWWSWLPGLDESGGPTDEIGRSLNPIRSLALVGGRLWAGGTWYQSEGGSSGLASVAVPDTSPPTASLTTSTINPAGSATVQSTEPGTAYLVRSSVSVTNEASITGAAGNLWNSATISASNTPTSIPATGLISGTYKVYVVDAAGNLSSASVNSVTIIAESPTVTLARSGSGTVGGSQDITITFTLSEASTNFAVGDVTVSTGTLSAFAGSGTTYTATWTPPASGSGT
ncbi:MAG: Ig-like domain-containing protein, partial [Actinomycetota bacterium]